MNNDKEQLVDNDTLMSNCDRTARQLDISDVDQEDIQAYQFVKSSARLVGDCKVNYSVEFMRVFNS